MTEQELQLRDSGDNLTMLPIQTATTIPETRRLRRGTEEGARTRHDVMEDMLVELRAIRECLERSQAV